MHLEMLSARMVANCPGGDKVTLSLTGHSNLKSDSVAIYFCLEGKRHTYFIGVRISEYCEHLNFASCWLLLAGHICSNAYKGNLECIPSNINLWLLLICSWNIVTEPKQYRVYDQWRNLHCSPRAHFGAVYNAIEAVDRVKHAWVLFTSFNWYHSMNKYSH